MLKIAQNLVAAMIALTMLAGCQTTSDQGSTDAFVKTTLQSQGIR